MPRAAGPRRAAAAAALCLVASAAARAAEPAPARLEIDPQQSEVAFRLQTTWHGVEGRTRKVSGALTSKTGAWPTDGEVLVRVAAASLETGNARRDRTMREKHLETGKHPDITFASTGAPRVISRADDPAGEPQRFVLEVSGALTIHGKSRPVTVEATARRAEPGWQMTGTLLVRLSDHEIPDPSIFLNRVKNEVTVTFSIRMNPAP